MSDSAILWQSHEIAQALATEVPGDFDFTGVSIDSRSVKAGDIFIAIQGGKLDGHDYVAEAFAKGAKLAIVSKDMPGNILKVANPLHALEALALAARKRAQGQVIAITGSVGKTSTKTAAGLVFSAQGSTYVSPGGFNNHWGVPLSMANTPPNVEFGIFEVGMNHVGEIDHLTTMLQPTIAMITNVESVHIANFENIEQIALAKAEIFNHGAKNCLAVLNDEHKFYDYLHQAAIQNNIDKFVTFGATEHSNLQLLKWEQTARGVEVNFALNQKQYRYDLQAFGRHWVINGLGVLALAQAAGLNIDKACASLSEFQLLPGRGDIINLPLRQGQVTIIDESYNSSPIALALAIGNLSTFSGRKIAILGDMLELGESAQSEHVGLANILQTHKIDLVFTSGPLMQNLHDALPVTLKAEHNDDPVALGHIIYDQLQSGDILLIKGSRGNYGPRGRMNGALEKILALAKGE